MSKNVVDCVIKHSQKHSIGLIPSRRQVDYCGGYVNNWDTQTFSEYFKNKKVLLCRDHNHSQMILHHHQLLDLALVHRDLYTIILFYS